MKLACADGYEKACLTAPITLLDRSVSHEAREYALQWMNGELAPSQHLSV